MLWRRNSKSSYGNSTTGRKNHMRLDALTYEKALREARLFLGIDAQDRDSAGDQWVVE